MFDLYLPPTLPPAAEVTNPVSEDRIACVRLMDVYGPAANLTMFYDRFGKGCIFLSVQGWLPIEYWDGRPAYEDPRTDTHPQTDGTPRSGDRAGEKHD